MGEALQGMGITGRSPKSVGTSRSPKKSAGFSGRSPEGMGFYRCECGAICLLPMDACEVLTCAETHKTHAFP